jgi:hypothetical protein
MNTASNHQEICQHQHICVITEIPTDGKIKQQEKVYVKCSQCNEVLPIQTIEQKTIEVPLIK